MGLPKIGFVAQKMILILVVVYNYSSKICKYTKYKHSFLEKMRKGID